MDAMPRIVPNFAKARQTCYDEKPSMKRASIGIALLIAGFVAGLVLTGRLRSAEESTAQTTPRQSQTAVAMPAAVAPQPAGLPDLTGIAEQAVKGVVNISSVQVVRRPNSPFANDPVFRVFLRRPRRHVRIARSARAKSRIGRADFR